MSGVALFHTIFWPCYVILAASIGSAISYLRHRWFVDRSHYSYSRDDEMFIAVAGGLFWPFALTVGLIIGPIAYLAKHTKPQSERDRERKLELRERELEVDRKTRQLEEFALKNEMPWITADGIKR